MGGSVESLHLVLGGKRCLEEKATYHVGGGANHAFREVKVLESRNRIREERARRGVVELKTIIALESTNRSVELGEDPSKEGRKDP